jgi:hypothetical protein
MVALSTFYTFLSIFQVEDVSFIGHRCGIRKAWGKYFAGFSEQSKEA